MHLWYNKYNSIVSLHKGARAKFSTDLHGSKWICGKILTCLSLRPTYLTKCEMWLPVMPNPSRQQTARVFNYQHLAKSVFPVLALRSITGSHISQFTKALTNFGRGFLISTCLLTPKNHNHEKCKTHVTRWLFSRAINYNNGFNATLPV